MTSRAPSSTPQPALRADAERNRRLILETARHAFAERGLGVRLDEIAQEAGIGIGTVYRRFKDKDELVRAVFEHVIAEVVALADAALQDDADGTGLRRFFDEALSRMAGDRALRQLLTGVPSASVDLATVGRELLEPRIMELAAHAHAAGRLRSDIAHHDLPVIQLMLTAALEATVPVRPDLWQRYVTLVLDAMEPRSGDRALPGSAPTGDETQAIIERWRLAPRQAGARG